jgi:hypothetical protein
MGATTANTTVHIAEDARRRLKAIPESAAEARFFVAETFIRWELRELIEDAKLIVSELVGNCVPVTPGEDVWVLLARERDAVWVCVWDSSPVLPQLQAYGLESESGRGLHIVAALAPENGAFQVAEPKGKITWARLTI